ncbi:hypothetical protein KAK06_12015 [Ideonella sp. 4Y11]|uniref:HAF repeat-containing protein n=1 Tax=Ideonella aquatica TaxID=2824119 RepID=A0A940YGB1_9BURK|nr:hypothetical protein [Ideonella aquatica]MBQ0959673.1 hypothetical protein [Ideonella aquatica]
MSDTTSTTHRSRASAWLLAGTLAAALAWPASGQAATTVQDLGGLYTGGFSSALALSQSGQAIGIAMRDGDFQIVNAQWSSGGVISALPDCCSGFLAMPASINRSGEAVGSHQATRDHWAAVKWAANGNAQYLPSLGSYGLARAFAINDAGQAVGSSVTDNFAQRAVRWNPDGSVTQLGEMGSPDPGYLAFHEAHGISNKGVVVGTALVGSAFRAFSWKGGQFTDLGLGNATHVNDKGLIAGLAPGRIPVIWKKGTMRYLPGRDGGKRAYGHEVLGINNLGDMVGFGPSPGVGVHSIAVLWRGGAALTLGHYPGGTHSVATGINDAGMIVGYGNLVDGGPMRALRWTVTSTSIQVELAPVH